MAPAKGACLEASYASASHAENDAGLIARAKVALIAAGRTAPRFHAASHPRAAEIEADRADVPLRRAYRPAGD